MQYYSNVTKKLYDSEDECKDAEAQYQKELDERAAASKKKNEERAARAKEVEDAYQTAIDATRDYQKLLRKFIEDYQSFHMTIRQPHDLIGDMFTSFFDLL